MSWEKTYEKSPLNYLGIYTPEDKQNTLLVLRMWIIGFAIVLVAWIISIVHDNQRKEIQVATPASQEQTCNVTGSCCDTIKNCLCSCQEKSY